MKSGMEPLLEVVLRHLLLDGARPPQIVPLPEDGEDYTDITVVLPEKTVRVIDALASTYGTTRNNIARILLNAVGAYVDSALEGDG